MNTPHHLDYATHQPKKRRLHSAIRILLGITSFFFLMPTINIVLGYDMSDGPVSKGIGIIVTLTIAFYLAYVSFTGRFRFRREPKSKDDGLKAEAQFPSSS